jgi:hypothetical protein
MKGMCGTFYAGIVALTAALQEPGFAAGRDPAEPVG